MATVIEVTDLSHLRYILDEAQYPKGYVAVDPYEYDERIGWDTHIVTIDGNAVGFTNGPLVGSNAELTDSKQPEKGVA